MAAAAAVVCGTDIKCVSAAQRTPRQVANRPLRVCIHLDCFAGLHGSPAAAQTCHGRGAHRRVGYSRVWTWRACQRIFSSTATIPVINPPIKHWLSEHRAPAWQRFLSSTEVTASTALGGSTHLQSTTARRPSTNAHHALHRDLELLAAGDGGLQRLQLLLPAKLRLLLCLRPLLRDLLLPHCSAKGEGRGGKGRRGSGGGRQPGAWGQGLGASCSAAHALMQCCWLSSMG